MLEPAEPATCNRLPIHGKALQINSLRTEKRPGYIHGYVTV